MFYCIFSFWLAWLFESLYFCPFSSSSCRRQFQCCLAQNDAHRKGTVYEVSMAIISWLGLLFLKYNSCWLLKKLVAFFFWLTVFYDRVTTTLSPVWDNCPLTNWVIGQTWISAKPPSCRRHCSVALLLLTGYNQTHNYLSTPPTPFNDNRANDFT